MWEVYCAGGYDVYFWSKTSNWGLYYAVLQGFGSVKVIPSLMSTVSFTQMLQDTRKALTTVQKPKHVMCNVYTSLLAKVLLFKHTQNTHRQPAGLYTSQRASWCIYCVHAWKIMTANVVLSVHLQAGAKTLNPTDCKTLHINLLVTKKQQNDVINTAILSQTQKKHCEIF